MEIHADFQVDSLDFGFTWKSMRKNPASPDSLVDSLAHPPLIPKIPRMPENSTIFVLEMAKNHSKLVLCCSKLPGRSIKKAIKSSLELKIRK